MKHHKAKADFAIVERARDMREYENMEIKEIIDKLQDEGHFIPYWTMVDWCLYRTRCFK